jgi:hypothetical protein
MDEIDCWREYTPSPTDEGNKLAVLHSARLLQRPSTVSTRHVRDCDRRSSREEYRAIDRLPASNFTGLWPSLMKMDQQGRRVLTGGQRRRDVRRPGGVVEQQRAVRRDTLAPGQRANTG